MNQLQDWTFDVGERAFGKPSMTDRRERLFRFAEEALELMQAGGMNKSEVSRMFEHVYSRRPGELKQEIGGVAVTLFALCSSHSWALSKIAGDETFRVASNIEAIRIKSAAKPADIFSTRAAV